MQELKVTLLGERWLYTTALKILHTQKIPTFNKKKKRQRNVSQIYNPPHEGQLHTTLKLNEKKPFVPKEFQHPTILIKKKKNKAKTT